MFFSCLRNFSSSNVIGNRIKSVAVIGSGLMGSGIAQVTAAANYQVFLIDQNEEILNKALKSIESNLTRVAKKKYDGDKKKQEDFIINSLSLIKPYSNTEQAVAQADLVIEAVVEDLNVKQKIFNLVESVSKSGTVIATNTSSLKLSDISEHMKRKENFGGLHFFNPVPVMKLLEVVRGDFTNDDTFNALIKYGESIGKDTPGFIVNRLLVPYLIESVRLFERGDASKEDIDAAMKLGAGYPMGPFQLLDYVGLDTTKFIMDGWNTKYPNEELFKPSKTINELVRKNKLGMKTGEGFYKYNSN